MKRALRSLLRYRTIVLIVFAAWLAAGFYAFLRLDIEAYPDPSPPLVEVITQNPSWSAEEMEQQVTVPIETTLNGIPQLEYIRSISIFGLSDVKMYFAFDSDYFRDRQEVLNRLQTVSLPNSLTPQISPWSAVGEIYRYQIEGAGYSLNDLKAAQDWLVRRELKLVPGIIDVSTFGGTTRQYQVEMDPGKLLQYKLTLPQVMNAVTASNANVGGNYLTIGGQSVNVRGIGLLRNLNDIASIVVAERNGSPVLLRDIAEVQEGYQPRLGKVGINNNDDAIKGTVLLQRGEQSLPALKALREKIVELNNGLLPPGMRLRTLYDRTNLINITTRTVRHIVLMGLVLVTIVLLATLGDLRLTFITALTIPASVLFAFGCMVLTGRSANLISIGAIDFGILVETAIVVLEHIFRKLSMSLHGESRTALIVEATAESARPVIFSTLIILVAFVPLFTMEGVPGKIFSPMSVTYGFALTGALIFALLFAPVLASFGRREQEAVVSERRRTPIVRWLHDRYQRLLHTSLSRPRFSALVATAVLLAAAIAFRFVGGEFMPPLEEGNLWIRATLPQDISFEEASRLADRFRGILRSFPEATLVISQMGRPDDGTDVTTFNNIEISCDLSPSASWRGHISKEELIRRMDQKLSEVPGVDFSFSQNIQDNVEEAMSGVKGENSLKLFGDDFDVLTQKANEIRAIMEKVRGVEDIGVFNVQGQPSLSISIDRMRAARYGLMPADVNAVVQAAIGGGALTQVLDGDRRFDLVLRYKPEFRSTPESIRNLLVATPDGGYVPLAQIADVSLREGSFMIYRENDRRYIPIKFSVRGRDLASTMRELQDRIANVQLPAGYTYAWAGEYDSLRKEQRRLALIIPFTLLVILVLLFVQFHSWRDSLIVLAILPFAVTGGVFTLLISGTPFSISAAVGFTSVIGVATLGAVVFLSGVRRAQREEGPERGLEAGSLDEMRPIVMACFAAGLGLLPASIATGIGAQAQQPLARVVVGGMLTTMFSILFLIPLFVRATSRRAPSRLAELPEETSVG